MASLFWSAILLLCASSARAEEPVSSVADLAARVCAGIARRPALERLVASLPPQLHDEDTPPDWVRRGYLRPAAGVRKLVLVRDARGSLVRAELTIEAAADLAPDDFTQLHWTNEELSTSMRAGSSGIVNGLLLRPTEPPPADWFRARLYPPGLGACEILGEGTAHPTATFENKQITYPPGAGGGTLERLTIRAAVSATGRTRTGR